MSNAEYVAQLDEDQLTNLIEQATARRESIRQSGWVKLWQVSIGWANVAWFPEHEHASAVEFAGNAVKEDAAKRPGKRIQMEVSLERFRPNEVAELLGQASAAQQDSAPCRNCIGSGLEPSYSGERKPCGFCQQGGAQKGGME